MAEHEVTTLTIVTTDEHLLARLWEPSPGQAARGIPGLTTLAPGLSPSTDWEITNLHRSSDDRTIKVEMTRTRSEGDEVLAERARKEMGLR